MEDSNVEPNEWWALAKTQFREELQKKLVAHKRNEKGYKRYLLAFKKVFLDFIYKSPNSLEPSGQHKRQGRLNVMEHNKRNKKKNHKISKEEDKIIKIRNLKFRNKNS